MTISHPCFNPTSFSQLGKYLEQSNVLDPVLEDVVAPIMDFFRLYVRKAVSGGVYLVPLEVRNLFRIVTQLCNVRGYKTIVKFFPHEVSDMEQVTELLHF